MSPLARAVLDAVRSDPEALAELADLLAPHYVPARTERPTAYTTATLGAELGVTAKTVRNAIGRGELDAVKRGGIWIIPPESATRWGTPAPRAPHAPPRPRHARRASTAGKVGVALSKAMQLGSVG